MEEETLKLMTMLKKGPDKAGVAHEKASMVGNNELGNLKDSLAELARQNRATQELLTKAMEMVTENSNIPNTLRGSVQVLKDQMAGHIDKPLRNVHARPDETSAAASLNARKAIVPGALMSTGNGNSATREPPKSSHHESSPPTALLKNTFLFNPPIPKIEQRCQLLQ